MSPELLERLLVQHAAALELFARQWTSAPEDCVQEAFVALARQPQPPDNVVPWLYRVVRNRAISASRRSQRRRKHESAAAELTADWFEPSRDELVGGARLTAALQTLDEQLREAIVARIWGGLSFEQIAEVAGVSTSTAHRRYESGLRNLREKLGLPCLTKKTTPTN